MWSRGKDKPVWPTFRKAKLDGDALDRLKVLPRQICFGTGIHHVHEVSGKMVSFGGTKVEYPCAFFEMPMYVTKKETGRKSALYLLCWLGEYSNGVIPHFGPQYPHVERFDAADVEKASKLIYCTVADALYGTRAHGYMDSEVYTFIQEIEKCHQ